MVRLPSIDLSIVGFGIAGATLALALDRLGLRLRIYDAGLDGSASPVAAGLITPITGKKLKRQTDFDTLRHAAVAEYRTLESAVDNHFLFERPALRVLTTDKELSVFQRDCDALMPWLETTSFDAWPSIRAEGSAVLMPGAARLDTRRFLEAARFYLQREHDFHRYALDTSETPTVWCCGFHERDADRIPALQWRPAKGEVLRIRIADTDLPGTVHANGLWLTPVDDNEALAGATYSWDQLDGECTTQARETLVEGIRKVLRVPFTIVQQYAGVRPIVAGRRPVIGSVDSAKSQWIFNGLGSKGALFAPAMAALLADHIVNSAPIPDAFDIAERYDPV